MKIAFDIGKGAVEFAEKVASGAIDGARAAATATLNWSGAQMRGVAELPLVDQSILGGHIRTSGVQLTEAGRITGTAMEKAKEETTGALKIATDALDYAGEVVRRALFENVATASILGNSFAGLPVSDIKPSFRLDGKDVGAADVVADMRAKNFKRAVICLPGLFCDDGMWEEAGEEEDPRTLASVMRENGWYPVTMRLNPGLHISDNGRHVLDLMLEFTRLHEERVLVVTYSQGGLLLRSALYQDREKRMGLAGRIQHALLISSPDGGSFIEKIGYLAALGVAFIPGYWTKAIALLGDQRSPAMKDLSHGIIREEDWRSGQHFIRYFQDLYFGELDHIDATQLYSVSAAPGDNIGSVFGDGVVELPSLRMLSEKVYGKKGPDRVHELRNRSHFQILPAPETRQLLTKILKEQKPRLLSRLRGKSTT